MKLEEIRRIEKALGLALPGHYIELVTNYPSELLGTEAEDFALLNAPESVIEANEAVRGKPFYRGVWPEGLLVIGENGCGDLYVTKLSATGFSTGYFDHEAPAFYPHSSSRAEFIEKVLQEQSDAGA